MSGASPMADPEALTPTSSHDDHHDGTEDGHSRPNTSKDRECQFCHQKFTSSSLGRHLDQFIHKKKPDGIHIVDEIRRLRGGITRRTARQSGKHDHDDSRTSNASPAPTQQSPQVPVVDTLNVPPIDGIHTQFNSLNWHSTGVINDLKDISTLPTALASPVSTPLSAKRNYSTFAGMDQPTTRPPDNEKETTIRALELSLREVLDSVHAATARATPRSSPFAFDLQSDTFPALVLRLLPPPPTLFSASPFSTSTSIPLTPPDASYLPVLRLNLETQIQTWKWNHLKHAQTLSFPTPHSRNLGDEADHLTHTASQYETFAAKHLDAAFASWSALSPATQQSTWTLELLRAFRTASNKTDELESKLEALTTEANRLAGQVEHLSRCQWPREMALWPPEPMRFSKVAADEIRGVNQDAGGESRGQREREEVEERWGYEKLVGKWRRRVREDRGRRAGGREGGGRVMELQRGDGREVGGRVVELQRGERSMTPELANGHANGGGSVSGGEQRRKSVRQSQHQHLVTSLADQDDRARELRMGLDAMNNNSKQDR
jgi:hypothetical protein